MLLALACPSPAQNRKVVALDAFHNNEAEPHYRWEGHYLGGYSEFAALLGSLGYSTKTIKEPLTKASLRGSDLLIIVDPDIPAEAPKPNYISPAEAAAVEQWVKAGGILLILSNDATNAEFQHLNGLARRFGIEFIESVHKDAQGSMKLTLQTPQGHAALAGGLKFYAVQVAPLKVTAKNAEILLSDGGTPLMALVRHGKGLVLALGDPWLYDEYIRSQDNYKLGESLFRYLKTQ